jgi:hypothetical protein
MVLRTAPQKRYGALRVFDELALFPTVNCRLSRIHALNEALGFYLTNGRSI